MNKFPALKHCTLIELEDQSDILMIVGSSYYSLKQLGGSYEDLKHLKRYLDGRHSIEQMHEKTKISKESIQDFLNAFGEMGLLRESPEGLSPFIPKEQFLSEIED